VDKDGKNVVCPLTLIGETDQIKFNNLKAYFKDLFFSTIYSISPY
jgi:hypothetical protein